MNILCMQLNCNRLLACARCKLWWMTPSWGTKAGDLPPETQFVLVELAKGGPYAVLLPLIDQDTYRATLRPSTRCLLSHISRCRKIFRGSWQDVLALE